MASPSEPRVELPSGGERAHFARSRFVPGLVAFALDNTTSCRSWLHETVDFCAVLEGSADVTYRRSNLTFERGDTMIYAPGETHRDRRIHKAGYVRVTSVAPSLFPRPLEPYRARFQDPALLSAIVALHDAVTTSAPGLDQESLLAELVARAEVHIDGASAEPARAPAAVRRVMDLIHARYAEALSLDMLAEAAGISKFHLVRVFKRETGMPPHAFLNLVRVHRAGAKLAAGQPSAAVAVEVGFVDQSHLNRHFLRHLGVTPGRFQREIRK
ncbi:helix-turn-helix domain-containing protein [Polyangium aurulentum]|uniref:helix-turn-helix domain-containing protein n=1 Tax=Polyangium aurulentum TaxID=2567896 RepID=UPI0010AE077B|nr:AraC family transcriptional regulator [Polyangium aurulentum]UQA56178.1 AraC family transcriptional regulator [Polyangium aurulentum]